MQGTKGTVASHSFHDPEELGNVGEQCMDGFEKASCTLKICVDGYDAPSSV